MRAISMKTLLCTVMFCLFALSSAGAANYKVSADFDRIEGVSNGDHLISVIALSPEATQVSIEGVRGGGSVLVEEILDGSTKREFSVKCGDSIRSDKPIMVIKHPVDRHYSFFPVLQEGDRQVVWIDGGYLLIAALEGDTTIHIASSGGEEKSATLQGGGGTFFEANQGPVTIVGDQPIRVFSGNIDDSFFQNAYLLLRGSDAYMPLRAIMPSRTPANDTLSPGNGEMSQSLMDKVMPWIGAAIDFVIGGTPAYAAASSETLIDNGDGTFTFTQKIDRYSTAPQYRGPYQGGIGFGYYNWAYQDWGFQHSFPYFDQPNLQILSSTLTVRAWDVDAEPWRGWDGEYDGISGDGNWLNPQYLQGTNNTWSITNFDVDPGSVYDGLLDVWVDIDMHHNSSYWATTLDYSSLSIKFTYIDNDPPFTPQLTIAPVGCTYSSNNLSANVVGPTPADPNGDVVTYRYRWLVDPGTGNFIDDEFAGRGDNTGAILPASATRNNDRWRVEVTPLDSYGARGTKAVVTFATIGQCNTPPIADAGQDQQICPGTLSLSGKDSRDPDGVINAYSWEIYLGGVWVNIGASEDVSYTFSEKGTYQIRLTVSDNYGATDDAIVFVTVGESACGFANVRLIDTIPTNDVEFVLSSATTAPYSVTQVADKAIVEWQLGSFQTDQTESISFDLNLYDLVPGESRLVDHSLELIYTDRTGKEIRYALPPLYVDVLQSAFSGTVATDKSVYGPNENALVTATIESLSGYSRTLDVKILVEDGSGMPLSEKVYKDVTFEPGVVQDFTDSLATGSRFAGDYRAHLLYFEGGKQIGEASTPFAITPDIHLTADIATDKARYGANEPVVLTSEVVSASANYILRELTARVTLSDTDGRRLYLYEVPIDSLLPQQTTQLNTGWNTGDAPKGRYTAQLQVLDASGILATSSTAFDIVGTATTGSGIKGAITAKPSLVLQGEEEGIEYSITNGGNEEIVDLPVTILIADAATLEVNQSIPAVVSLPVFGQDGETITVSTDTLAPGNYLALLQIAPPDMPPKTLARTSFEVFVDLRPKLEVTKNISGRGNILVWLNYPWESGQHCPDRVPIERALRESGMLYQIVTGKNDFQQELRNPLYTDFVILGDHQPMEDHFSEELREQVNKGKGLIASLFTRKNLDGDLFGVKPTGYLPGDHYALELLPSDISAGTDFNSSGRAIRTEVLDDEDNVGWLLEESQSGIVKYPGAIVRQYGLGRVVFLPFDLGLASSNYDPFALLFTDCLRHVHSSVADLLPGQPVRVELTLRSLVGSVNLKVEEIFQPEVALFDTKTGLELSNPWTMDLFLLLNEKKSLYYTAVLPREKGTYTLTSDISYADGGIWNVYGAYPLDLVVERNTYDLLEEISFAIDTLNPTLNSDRINVAAAKTIVAGIPNYEDGSRSAVEIQQIIHALLKAVDAIIAVQSVDVTDVRRDMDSLLSVFEARWHALQ